MKKSNKYFSPNNVKWNNSVYFYNKNNIKLLPNLDNIVLKIIKSFYNMYNTKAEKSINLSKLTKRKRWLSVGRKLWINKLNIKHTNDKLIVNIFIYDRINNAIIKKFKQLLKHFYSKRFLIINDNSFKSKLNFNIPNKNLTSYISKINTVLNNKFLENIKDKFENLDNEINNSIKIIIDSLRIKFTKKILKQEMNILYYKRFLYLNTLKYNNKLIWILQKFIGKIYNKKITFNIVLLKNFYLDSNILTQILVHKSKDRNKKVGKILGDVLSIMEIPVVKKSMVSKVNKNKYYQKVILKDNINNVVNDNLNIILKNYYNTNSSITENEILNSLKNKSIIGVRLEAAGRLTRRFTAQRAVKNIKYIGTLKNVDSSFKSIPVEMLLNNKKNNIQFSKAKSENRIGSFGVRGWINSV